jgi:hypothetical protein
MALTQTQIDDILDLDASSGVDVGAYLKVTWDEDDSNETRYYASTAYNQLANFMNIGVPVEARLKNNIPDVMEFEINPDLRTEEIDVTFDDIDKEITGRFQTFGSGVRAEIVYYYPQVDGFEEVWEGQLKAPKEFGWKDVETIITNGTRSRELKLPGSNHPVGHCRFTFGGLLPTLGAVACNGCPYDRHLGGTVGNLNGAVPFTDCPRDKAACVARLGGDADNPLYYGGFDSAVGAIVTDPDTGWHATTQSNVSNLKDPIIVVFGVQWISPTKLFWRRDPNTDNPATGWFDVQWELCEGEILAVTNFKVNDAIVPAGVLQIRNGTRGQATTGYASDVPHFSSTVVAWSRIGHLNPDEFGPEDFTATCQVLGLRNVTAFNPTAAGSAEVTGLLATFYGSPTFTNEAGQRVLANISQRASFLPPISTLSLLQRFSLTVEGSITFEFSELTTLTLEVTGGARVTVNGSVIINQLASTGGTHTGNFTPTAGTPYTFLFEFVRNPSTIFPSTWKFILKWNSASLPIEVIPSSAFSITTPPDDGTAGIFTDDRVWALLECYTNYKWGRRYNPDTKFWVDSWNHTQRTLAQHVTHSFTNSDGDVRTFTGRRSTMNAVLKGRPTDEQVTDICRSGRMCVPFWHQGKFYLKPFRPFSAAELAAARVFTDTGQSQNIFWEDGQPSVKLSWTPDDEIVNKVEMRFNDRENRDMETPIFVDDKDQMLRAGRTLGDENLQEVPKQYSALGVGFRQEAVRLARHILWFGEFCEGGIQNNLAGTFLTSFEQVLGILRYDVIELSTELLDGFIIGTDNGEMDLTETPQYFRVMNMFKVGRGMVEMVVQAYNDTAETAFETVLTPPSTPGDPPGSPLPSPDPQEPPTTPLPPPPLPGPEPPTDDPGPIIITREPLPDPSPLPTVAYDAEGGYIEVEVTG